MNNGQKKGKLFVVAAPSGCGKSTIINSILDDSDMPLQFSVSATNRAPRDGEVDGVHYHFMTTPEFKQAVAENKFIEWEEVYPGRYYGTLESELRTALNRGENIVLDIDVKGAMNVKKIFGDDALTLFILPPSIDELRKRLVSRGTEDPSVIDERIAKAQYEISFADKLDKQLVNDDLERAIINTRRVITDFLNS
ncbi:MAG: guanylate kinase [Muribaculaceae bacterium]|nr:guanylate kinase [Muribaculaceae bacterium]